MIDPPTSCWVVHPSDNPYSQAFLEIAKNISYALSKLDIPAPVMVAADAAGCGPRPLVFGANVALKMKPRPKIPIDAIIFQLEQFVPRSGWFTHEYLELMRYRHVLDYSPHNIAKLAEEGLDHVRYCPIGYTKALEDFPEVLDKSVDVVHFGWPCERRKSILKEMGKTLEVLHLFNVWGRERNQAINRGKIVLNLHYFPQGIFEVIRVGHLLANRIPVVSETGLDAALEAPFKDAVHFVPYAGLIDSCVELAHNGKRHKDLGERGHEIFRQMDQVNFIKKAFFGANSLEKSKTAD